MYEPYQAYEGEQIIEGLQTAPLNDEIRLWVSGENLDGRMISKLSILPTGPEAGAEQQLQFMGLQTSQADNKMMVDMVSFDSPAEAAGIDFDWSLNRLEVPVERPPRQLIWIPALLLLGLIFLNQRRRSALPQPVSAT